MIQKKKLVAVTHNYIGECLAKSFGNAPIELEDRVLIPISGDHLANPINFISPNVLNYRSMRISFVRDPRIAEQHPDILLLYVGQSPMKEALEFAALFVDSEIHLVFNKSGSKFGKEYEKALEDSNFNLNCILHFAEPTGNNEMAELVNKFLQSGSLK